MARFGGNPIVNYGLAALAVFLGYNLSRQGSFGAGIQDSAYDLCKAVAGEVQCNSTFPAAAVSRARQRSGLPPGVTPGPQPGPPQSRPPGLPVIAAPPNTVQPGATHRLGPYDFSCCPADMNCWAEAGGPFPQFFCVMWLWQERVGAPTWCDWGAFRTFVASQGYPDPGASPIWPFQEGC